MNDDGGNSRRKFLAAGVAAVGGASIAGAMFHAIAAHAETFFSKKASAGHAPGTHPSGALQKKITRWETTEKPDGNEFVGDILLADSGGATDTLHFFGKWAVRDDGYTITYRFSPSVFSVGYTCIISGKKGTVSGDRRADKVTISLIGEDGTVHREPEREIRVFITNPYEGMSPADAGDAFLRDKALGRFDH